MSDYSSSELRDMAPAFVLGALSDDERTAFEAALHSSPELADEVAAFSIIIERLGSEKSIAPPPELRARFLDKIASTKTRPIGAAPPAASPKPFTVSSNPTVTTAPRARWWLSGALAVALAASLIFAVRRNSDVNALTVQLAARDSVIKQRDVRLSQRDATLNTVLEAERDLVVVNLTSVPTQGPGIQFFWNKKQGLGLIHAFRLKPAAPGRAYELWLIKDGKPVPIKVFNSDADEHGLVYGFQVPKDATGVTAVAITEEPAGGSPQPTSTPFLVGAVGKAAQ
jgi:anti-sigma-K factor RskA